MEFRHFDTSRPDGVYIEWSREECPDTLKTPLDYLFQDPDYEEEDRARLEAFNAGEWSMIGIRAKASITIIRNGVGTIYTMTSAGLYGVESDSGEDYLNEIFEEEKAAIKADLITLKGAI
jgi:hypothetical protein